MNPCAVIVLVRKGETMVVVGPSEWCTMNGSSKSFMYEDSEKLTIKAYSFSRSVAL